MKQRSIIKPLHKDYCEVCGETNKATIVWHHIVERKQLNTSNDPFNIAVICASCHAKIHQGNLKIIAVYSSTRPPAGRTLIFEQDGIRNIDGLEPVENKPIGLKIS